MHRIKLIISFPANKIQIAMTGKPLDDDKLNAGIHANPVVIDCVEQIIFQKNPYLEMSSSLGLSTDEV